MEKYIDLRLELESMPSQQLAERLREETGKEVPDDDLVLLILGILEERDADKPVQLGPKSEEVWNVYQNRVKTRVRKPAIQVGWVARVAIIIMAATILFSAIPREVQADTFWDMLVRWTSYVVEFFGYRDNDHRIVEYEFKTDNPGLQQVYDAVVEMGIMNPVVPMWLPDGYELDELNIKEFPAKSYIHSRFVADDRVLIFQVDIYHMDVLHKYQKDESVATIYETNGIIHSIMQNNEQMVAVWACGNIECSLSSNCQEDVLKKIIDTIYG